MRRVALIGIGVVLWAGLPAYGQTEQMIPETSGAFCPDMCIDQQGNAHLVWAHWSEVNYARFDAQTQAWSEPIPLPYSGGVWTNYGRPKVEVGPDCHPQVIWCHLTEDPSARPAPLRHARALNPQGTQWEVTTLKNDWTAWVDLAVDDSNQPHIIYQRPAESGYEPAGLVYLDPWGVETCVRSVWLGPVFPMIGYNGGLLHTSWSEAANIWYANSNDWSGTAHPVSQTPGGGWYPGFPRITFKPDGTVGMVFFFDDWGSGWGYHKAVCYSEDSWSSHADLFYTNAEIIEQYNTDDWWPEIAYDTNSNRYVVWTHHDPGYNETYYKINDDAVVTLPTAGHITVAGGPNGALVVRCKPTGGALWWFPLDGGGSTYYPPTAVIDSIVPNPAYQQQDVVSFSGSAWDNDENGQSITAYEWSSDRDGLLSNAEDFQRSADDLSVGQHVITFKVWDDENQTAETTANLAVSQLWNPTARIDSITPNPATQQVDMVHFEASAWDNDEGGQAIVSYEWSSSVDGILAYSEDFDRLADDLTVGAHLITFEVVDDDGQTAQDTLTLIITPPPLPPTAVIDSILPNPATQDVDAVAFYGSAWDNDENGQAIVSYRWSSDMDGILSNQEDFTQPASELSVGYHLITLKVWDDESQTAQDTLTLVINPSPFQPPTAVIDSIVPQTAYHDVDTVSFYGSAWDNDENGQSITAYEWSSDIDGPVGAAEDFSLPANSLSVGTHIITFMVWDDESQTAQDTMSIIVNPSPFHPPTAVIDSIVPDSANCWLDTVYFYGSAWDNDENGESIEAYEWTSSLDGALAAAQDFFVPADSLSAGVHLITFEVWDDEQQTGQDTMTVVVVDPGSVPPTAVVDSIWPSPAMQERDTVHFSGSAWDNDPTDVIETYEWWSSLLGAVLSNQADFDLPADSLPLGLNNIRFTAWDDEGDSAVAWGFVSIVGYTPPPLPPQNLVCEYQEAEARAKLTWIGPLGVTFSVYHDSTAYFTGADPVGSDLTGPPWYHEDPDLTRAHFYYVTSESAGGESVPSDRVGLVPYELSR